MKKILLILCLAGLSSLSSKAQNSFLITIDAELCLNHLTVIFTDNTVQDVNVGCAGDYSVDIGGKVVHHVLINGVNCYIPQTTNVKVNENKDAKAKFSQFGQHISVSSPG